MLSSIAFYGFIAGTAAVALVGTIFVVTMRKGTRQLEGWKKTALHPKPYLRFAGISYGVALAAFLLGQLF